MVTPGYSIPGEYGHEPPPFLVSVPSLLTVAFSQCSPVNELPQRSRHSYSFGTSLVATRIFTPRAGRSSEAYLMVIHDLTGSLVSSLRLLEYIVSLS